MGVHKLTAGDGYTYLTRQVAAHDATDRGYRGLADYYSEKGESPGTWFGSGLGGVDLAAGSVVSEEQMRNLFGEGRHPNAQLVESRALDAGASVVEARGMSQLGRVFAVYRGNQPEFTREAARRYVAYNLERGEHWRSPVPAEVRASIRTELGNELFAQVHGRAPLDARERGGFMAKSTRQQTSAVAGYDLTFTPVKSVSTLWAVGDHVVAKQVEEAHHEAVRATLQWLEREALFTRRGRGGIQQVRTHGLIAAIFTHRDSRSSDPHLHTHVAVSNKVQDREGRWLAVDGRVLFKANVACSEMYNTLLEAELRARLGVQFAPREPADSKVRLTSKRPVREVVGVDGRLAQVWSKRHHAIEDRRRDLTARFQAEHGRPPTDGETTTLAEKAWETTRARKHEPRAEADQRKAWRLEAATVLGGERAVDDMVSGCQRRRQVGLVRPEGWVSDTAARVVERVAADRATWQVWHIRAEAQRQVRGLEFDVAEIGRAIDQIVDRAISDHCLAMTDHDPLLVSSTASAAGAPIPHALVRDNPEATLDLAINGRVSVYSLAGGRQYTSRAVLAAEHQILAGAHRADGWRIREVEIDAAIAAAVDDSPGVRISAAQQSMVRTMATSGRLVQLGLAPAGTGKTTAVKVLARAWRDAGGTVIGLAPSAVAAHELGTALTDERRHSTVVDTLSKLVWHTTAENEGSAPAWMRQIDRRTLVVIDEAGMASTADLACAIGFVTRHGGQLRLLGDDRQLAAVGAGGVLRDIAHQVGAVTLSEVHRFTNRDGSVNHAESAATLAVREGDPSSIAYYADRGRIHVGDLGSCADQAYAAWLADLDAGQDSILIAPTRQLVAELNTRARDERIARSGRSTGLVMRLGDGTLVSRDDQIITRENNRLLRLTSTDWVKNGDRWHVRAVHDDGSLSVTHDVSQAHVVLPAVYVADSVQLGYATTVHGVQGITTNTCHVVLDGSEDRNLLYVALSRGRSSNHLYLNVTTDGDPHNMIRPAALIPPTAIDLLTRVLGRDGRPTSATTLHREEEAPGRLLHHLAARYHDALTSAAESILGPDLMTRIDHNAARVTIGLTNSAAWPTLRSHLALLAFHGHDPLRLLATAVVRGSLEDARDPAAVLDARIDGMTSGQLDAPGPLPWLPGIPAQLRRDGDWGAFLSKYFDQVREHVAAVRTDARRWGGGTVPAWAQPFLDEDDAELRADLAVWRAVTAADDHDLRPTGERAIGAPGVHQARLDHAVQERRPSYSFAQRGWYQSLPAAVKADPWATPLCQRLERLDRAGMPVADYIARALRSDPTQAARGAGRASPVPRPLPDEHQAAALWWRLVPHLGPAALGADDHSADLLRPAWLRELEVLLGTVRSAQLQRATAWPALVAAVDEAVTQHGWRPAAILRAGLGRPVTSGHLTGAEIADALVVRIALLNDEPAPPDLEPPEEPDMLPPDGIDQLMVEHHHQHRAALINSSRRPRVSVLAEASDQTALEQFPASGEIPAERLYDLNAQALAYFESCYPRSWAPSYVRDRFHTDLSDQPAIAAGYAPGLGQSLLRHLVSRGATTDELFQAGLIARRERRDGSAISIDFFRDRLVLPIRDPHDPSGRRILGFIGRRNPTKNDDARGGPKYLNTRGTTIFTKSEALFGYVEAVEPLRRGALPVVVEGPMDALAITLGSEGSAVGIAPMGTALTDGQVKLLLPHIDLTNARDHVAVATDSDSAGWMAARKAFWQLTACDLDPLVLLPAKGMDPSQLYESGGARAIEQLIKEAQPLGDAMIRRELNSSTQWSESAERDRLVDQVARILAARGPDRWAEPFGRLTRLLSLAPGTLQFRTLTQSIEFAADPPRYARLRIASMTAEVAPRGAGRPRIEDHRPRMPALPRHRNHGLDQAVRDSRPTR